MQRKPTFRALTFTPLANGLDYLDSVVAHLGGKPTKRDLKYAVLHLYSAIEVLLKYRLIREHWTTVVSRMDSADKTKFESGDFESASSLESYDRLVRICGLPLDKEDRKKIETVGKLRNKLQHFGLSATTEEVAATTARALDFLWRFIHEHVVPGAEDDEEAELDDVLDRVRADLGTILSLVTARMKELDPILAQKDVVVDCPACRQSALIVDDTGVPTCAFCYREWVADEAASEYVGATHGLNEHSVLKDGGVWPVYSCVNCSEETLVSGVSIREQEGEHWVCFTCGMSVSLLDLDACTRCGAITDTSGDDGAPMCSSCWAEVIRSD
ncbi:hypothetical protein RB614_20250 [Phytohabitans sp. ZYX-F-186]|uniref:DUF4145 domain-containing protein n=1 Tax=Phytohabitans maris TaxID=3071409 RepID=A0ABU0ZIL5_9ACTN|nr:hypothetical protein [Phytohabitans sp. ZYX-F-186]MDQ7906850.1 hypothetical protein [Phytohabitans sp. ZYX-F-186]